MSNSPFRLLAAAAILLLSCLQATPKPKLRALILDGQNNHDWKATSASTKATLEACGRFEVDVATSPADREATAEWAAWNPKFRDYDVVVSNFNDGGHCLWSDAMRSALLAFVEAGGGLVVVHAADNSSSDWPEYNRLIGVGGWGERTPANGSHMRLVAGEWRPDPAPDEASGSHGAQLEFVVQADRPEHPILAGLPAKWKHGQDELYDSLRGPCEELTVLASADCPRTQRREPVLMEIRYGKGRVVHDTMGHVGGTSAIQCVGFQTVLARSAEYAATGAVSIPAPAQFPSEAQVSVVPPAEVRWR